MSLKDEIVDPIENEAVERKLSSVITEASVILIKEKPKVNETTKEEETAVNKSRLKKNKSNRNNSIKRPNSKSILKNGTSRDSYSMKMRAFLKDGEVATLSKEPDRVIMRTNLDISNWSVGSFDTCNGDAKRTFATFFAGKVGLWLRSAKSLDVLKFKDEKKDLKVEDHVDSDYEDDEPYGPHYGTTKDSETNFKNDTTFNRIKRLASLGTTKKSTKSRKSTNRNSNRNSVYSRMSKMLSVKKKKKKFKMKRENSIGTDADPYESIKMQRTQSRPTYIPPDMEWDPNYNEGQGRLVNKKPAILPESKEWDRYADGGMGKVINKSPIPSTIPPGKIWSRTAFNNTGGVVNVHPEHIPPGQMWDSNAADGMGGLVDATPEYEERMALKREKALNEKKRKARKSKKRKHKSSGRIKLTKSEVKLSQDKVKLNPNEAYFKTITDENDLLIAQLDEQERRAKEDTFNGDVDEIQEIPPYGDAQMTEEPEQQIVSKSDILKKFVQKDDEESVLILKTEVPEVKEEIQDKISLKEKDELETLQILEKEPKLKERSKSGLSRKRKIRLKTKTLGRKHANRRKSQKLHILLAAADSPVVKAKAEKLGIEEGRVLQMYEKFENMSVGTDEAVGDFDKTSDSEKEGEL